MQDRTICSYLDSAACRFFVNGLSDIGFFGLVLLNLLVKSNMSKIVGRADGVVLTFCLDTDFWDSFFDFEKLVFIQFADYFGLQLEISEILSLVSLHLKQWLTSWSWRFQFFDFSVQLD
jgi:hypothetical protein